MISRDCLRRAVSRMALLKYFPTGNQEAVAAVAEMFADLFTTDEEVSKAVSSITHDPEMAEWPGAGAFFGVLQRAVYPRGMWKVGGRWVPSPDNGPKYDIVHPDGSRHWHNGGFLNDAAQPRRRERKPEGEAATEAAESAKGTSCAAAGISDEGGYVEFDSPIPDLPDGLILDEWEGAPCAVAGASVAGEGDRENDKGGHCAQ